MPDDSATNLQVRLKRRPVGTPVPDDFTIAAGPLPEPAEGEALIRTIWLSLDPYMRGRMSALPPPTPSRSRSAA